ncbi:MAG: HAD-IC family P-type ATPase, partial [Candidatus Lokiarchaeota archaeon]|nr:HAD-IC family P-type ATPase [Candidatus Lokiarchaeota archaeon]MBD3343157.1 HAD-IC family P-type ATPase [Candidatus Lokiarchaeota archaeon]
MVTEKENMEEKYYTLDLKQIYEKFNTDPAEGLSKDEAEKRFEELGPNEIPRVSKGFIKIYLAPLFNWLIVIYLIGALILFVASLLQGQDSNFYMIALTLGIVGLNCIVAIVQQFRATKKLNALRELSAPTTTVIRDGDKTEVMTKKVVVGDLLVLEQGDKIPADARIIQSSNMEVNEASLTGESESVMKMEVGRALEKDSIPVGDRKNMVFYGTYVTMGTGSAITVSTGGDTEIGKISRGLEEAGTSEIPIRKKMNNFGKWLGLAVLLFWFIILMIIYIASGFTRLEIVKSLNSAMDIMPINIPLLTTIVLLTGVLAMARQGVIIRNLASVDSLGRVSVVCSDKTGTMTKNQMSVQYAWVYDSLFKASGSGYDPDGDIFLMDDPKNLVIVTHVDDFPQLKQLLVSGFLNNNAALVKNEIDTDGKVIYDWKVLGSPTEGALMVLFQKAMGDYVLDDYKSIKEFPFDSSLKRMTKAFRKNSSIHSFTKGASEIVIPLCSKILTEDGEIEFSEDLKNKVMNKVDYYANMGYRILSICYKRMDDLPFDQDNAREICESDMVYIGFVTILDPPREGVKQSVEQCHNAGVEVIMITGDSPATARAIGSQIAIVEDDDDLAIEGNEIEHYINKPEFDDIKVFARVSPKHKQDIVEKYQSEKRVVAMTGDGVNDALALNMADAGIAMGIQGTDVAKEASDMVISDDSFNSIVKGIHQGRGIFAKIRAVVFFYICINLFEGIVQFILAVIFDLPYFLDEQYYWQWIFLSITLHTFPGLILTFDIISDDVMKDKPKDSEEILSRNTVYLMLAFGALLALSMVITYFVSITGIYPVFKENHEFGFFNDGYLYSSATSRLTEGTNLRTAKSLTMLMVTL